MTRRRDARSTEAILDELAEIGTRLKENAELRERRGDLWIELLERGVGKTVMARAAGVESKNPSADVNAMLQARGLAYSR